VLRAIHADCASSNATESAPLNATIAISQPIESAPTIPSKGIASSAAARSRSQAIIVRRFGQR
jgi:hypothetical protein